LTASIQSASALFTRQVDAVAMRSLCGRSAVAQPLHFSTHDEGFSRPMGVTAFFEKGA
jgi:hypothetical protein